MACHILGVKGEGWKQSKKYNKDSMFETMIV